MIDVWFTTTLIIGAVVALVGGLCTLFQYDTYTRSHERDRKAARVGFLTCLMVAAAPLWPVSIPIGLLALMRYYYVRAEFEKPLPRAERKRIEQAKATARADKILAEIMEEQR